MNGNLKVLEVSTDSFILKRKRTYKNVNIHFRDYNTHTLTLSRGKLKGEEIILNIQGVSIEAESLLIEADAWLESDEKQIPKILELRFYPEIQS
tara:strand:+ start:261 stop:542 length:282 start_codon:yes stop_codon:yes gene_type:complete